MNPEVLYNRSVALRGYVRELERSSAKLVPWPLLVHAAESWKTLTESIHYTANIFFTVGEDHNYRLSAFSQNLRADVERLIPSRILRELFIEEERCYCLYIPEIESINVSMHANVLHEYGHAIWDGTAMRGTPLGMKLLEPVYGKVAESLARKGGNQVLIDQAGYAIQSMAMELFADAVAARVVGPSFVLSLREMSMGKPAGRWSIRLDTRDQAIRGYPSTAFRITMMLKSFPNSLFIGADRDFRDLPPRVKGFPQKLDEIRRRAEAVESDIKVGPRAFSEASVLEATFLEHLPHLEDSLETFVEHNGDGVIANAAENVALPSPERVAPLVDRLVSRVVPNIVPDGSLLGAPSAFADVLCASSIVRFFDLNHNGETGSVLAESLARNDRLTQKALEVSHVQRKYEAWKSSSSQGDSAWA